MLARTGRHVSYSNVIATVALFVALGGSAYAISNNSVKSRHIDNGQVKSGDLQDNGVKSKDVRNENLTGTDVDDGSLGGDEIAAGSMDAGAFPANELGGDQIDESTLYPSGGGTGQNPFGVPISGVFSGQALSIGGDGATTFATLNGRALAEGTMAAAASGTAANTLEFGELRVRLAAPLAAGQSRTFTVVRASSVGDPPLPTTVACTIEAGENECVAAGRTQSNNALIALRIESDGVGLAATDDAYFGAAARIAVG
jgi:hypothetical protein